jgi:hypothetical protein
VEPNRTKNGWLECASPLQMGRVKSTWVKANLIHTGTVVTVTMHKTRFIAFADFLFSSQTQVILLSSHMVLFFSPPSHSLSPFSLRGWLVISSLRARASHWRPIMAKDFRPHPKLLDSMGQIWPHAPKHQMKSNGEGQERTWEKERYTFHPVSPAQTHTCFRLK